MTSTDRAESARSPEELREELGELRAELGDTVEELAHRADVPTRLREMRTEAAHRVQAQVAQTRDTIAETAPVVQSTLRERPALVTGIAVALTFLLVSVVRRRWNTGDGDGTG